MAKAEKKKKNVILSVIIALVVVYVVFLMVDMQVSLAAKKEELQLLEQEYEIRRMENKDLKRQIANGVDEEEVERVAREQLEYVAPEEKVFIDISGS